MKCRVLGMLALALWGCGEERLAKGVSSETTNGGNLIGRVLDAQNQPAVGVRVVALREDPSLPDSARIELGAATTTSDGLWQLALQDTTWHGNILLVAQVGEQAAMQRSRTLQSQVLRLQAFQKLEGTARWESGERAVGLRAYVLGLGVSGEVGATGRLSLPHIPSGSWVVRVRSSARALVGEAAMASTAISVADTSVISLSPRPSILLDDFETINEATRLYPLLGDSYWAVWRDSSVQHPGWEWLEIKDGYTRVAAWNGQSLHVSLQPVGDSTRTSGLSGSFGGAPGFLHSCWHDLRRLDSVRFWAKGSGSVDLRLFARSALDTLNNGTWRAKVVLTSQWTRYAFASQELRFVPEGWSNVPTMTWEEARMTSIDWQAVKPAELWLDDVVLVGLRPTDLMSCQTW